MVLSPAPRLRVFRVQLDPGRSFYGGGERVGGAVLLEAGGAPCRVGGLRVSAAGGARLGRHGPRDQYLDHQQDLSLEETLSRDSDGSFLLPAGKSFSFPFWFELPPPGQLVSSFRGKFGSVRYFVRAELRRPPQQPLQSQQELEVEEPLDVGQTHLLAPAAASAQRRLTCMLVPDGQVALSARIERRGFCPGEDVSIWAKFENTCSRIVVPKAAIVAQQQYAPGGRGKSHRQKLAAVRGTPIISGMCDMWQGRSLRVPRIRPTLGCPLLQVDYALMVYLSIPGSQRLSVELPLVIGTFSGVGSRTSSLGSWTGSTGSSWSGSSQTGSSWSGSSWASFPSLPPRCSSLQRDLGGGGPRTPLLDDYDGAEDDEGGLTMTAPQVGPPPPELGPPPPACSQVGAPPQEGPGPGLTSMSLGTPPL